MLKTRQFYLENVKFAYLQNDMKQDSYQILISKLDEFIRKYYKNQLIRGGILFCTTALFFFLIVTVSEYFAHFGIIARTILFYSYLAINFFILIKLVIIPIAHLNKLGKIITHKQVAEILGKFFSNIQDKLLNTLQLQDLNKEQIANKDLIEASINQKILELKPIPFVSAIDIKENKKYIKFLIVPLIAILVLLFVAPSIISKSANRLVKHDTFFEEEAPFKFNILNKKLETVQQKDFVLDLKLTGDKIPENIYILIAETQYKLDKESTIIFHYTFKNLQKSTKFNLVADGFTSREYEVKVLPNPIIINFQIALNYPAYLNKKDEVLNNTGDLIIPEGTKATWKFLTKDTKELKMLFGDSLTKVRTSDNINYSFSRIFRQSGNYTLITSNQFVSNKDSVSYTIGVVPDIYPSIQVETFRDSISLKRFYFTGTIKDDYGFNRLTFTYNFLQKGDSTVKSGLSKVVSINPTISQQQFYYYWDLAELNIAAGDEIEYYFEVWDNDGVNGPKASRSQKMIYHAPSLAEMEAMADKNSTNLKENMEESIIQAKQLQKDIEDLNFRMLQKKNMTWEDKKKAQDIIEKQKDLQKKVEEIQKENLQNNQQQNELSKTDEKIAEKQKQLEELMKNIMTDEMKKLFEELQKMMENADKQKMQEMMDKMKLSNKDVEKELDRSLEIFKQLELEQKLALAQEKLEELAKRQEELSKETEKKNADNNQLQKEQEKLKEAFSEVKKDLKELDQKNKELEEPKEMKNSEAEQKEVQQQMDNAAEQLKDKKNSKASQSQKGAAQKMKEMAQNLQKMQEEMEAESQSEDAEALRAILENLLKISFDQEALMAATAKAKINDPQYIKLIQQQKKLKDDAAMVEDSLFALSKRVVEIQSLVNREISSINSNMDKAIENMVARNLSQASSREQYVMTSVNNLALMLSESLQQMQQQSQKQSQGKCKKPGCSKPGSGKPSASSMRKMQEQLNKQLQKMKEGMEKPGQMGKNGNQSMSEQLAKMAAQQEAIRNELQKMSESLKNDTKSGSGKLDKIAKDMEQTETDIVNKMISNETLKRQQDILTRLLEAEKSEREREMEEKRESHEAKNEILSNPFEKYKYNYIKKREAELLKSVPPSLNQFYKNKVNEYFNNFGE